MRARRGPHEETHQCPGPGARREPGGLRGRPCGYRFARRREQICPTAPAQVWQGCAHLGWGLRARAVARGLRRPRHARRRLSRSGIHVADARSDGRRRRSRGNRQRLPVHRQELRGRRDEFPDGRRPGRLRVKLSSADTIADEMVNAIVEDLAPGRGAEALLFVNGFGGTPAMELYLMVNSALRVLRGKGVHVSRYLTGSYVTSLEMAGCSITVSLLDDALRKLWDAPVHTAALRWGT